MLLPENADKVAAVPACLLSIAKTGGVYRSACGGGDAAKAAGGQPELIFRRPAGLLQCERTHDQHLALQILAGHIVALGAGEQLQLCLCLAEVVDEAVQHGGVALHGKLIIAVAGRDEGGGGPRFVLRAESSVVLLLLKRGGQHPPHTFESEIIDDTSGAVTVQVHPIKAPADGFLDGLLTGDVLQVACPPEGHLVLPFGLGEGTEIEVGVVFSHWLSHFQGSPWSAHRSMWSCGHRIPPEQRRPR